MFVYLKHRETNVLITYITLQNGCKPVTGRCLMTPDLEPAIWFKSLLIEFILIDCDKREVRWKSSICAKEDDPSALAITATDLPSPARDSGIPDCFLEEGTRVHTLFDNAICVGYDTHASELFSKAISLCTEVVSGPADDDGEYDVRLLHIVHSYILPSLVIRRSDEDNLNAALKFIDSCILAKDSDIQTWDTLSLENYLAIERKKLVHEFQAQNSIRASGADFLLMFLQHLSKDISGKQGQLCGLQHKVNGLKTGVENDDMLKSARSDRDLLSNELERYIIARENIKQFICRPSVGNRYRLTEVAVQTHAKNTYFHVGQRLVLAKETLKQLFSMKLKLIIVKQAISMTLDDLQHQEETIGIEVIKGSSKLSTDVLSPTSKSVKLRTLKENVCELLSSEPLLTVHMSYCIQVVERIGAAIRAHDVTKHPLHVAPPQTLMTIGQNLAADITNHILIMCDKVHKHLPHDIMDNIRVNYEASLFAEIWRSLLQFYEAAHEPTCRILAAAISGKTVREMQIDCSWMVKPLHDAKTCDSYSNTATGFASNEISNPSEHSVVTPENNPTPQTSNELLRLVDDHYEEKTSPDGGETNTDIGTEKLDFLNFADVFRPALECIRQALKVSNIEDMMKLLTKAYRLTGERISSLCMTSEWLYSCEDLLSACIILLTYADETELRALYVRLHLANDLMSDHHRGDVYDCCLATFLSAMRYHDILWTSNGRVKLSTSVSD